MSDVRISCAESPLAWPAQVDPADLKTCSTCALSLSSFSAGSLQILTRRQGGGVGDGVNIEEAPNVFADYRGQRYALDETIFHTPGLHTFPGHEAPYPAEVHIHMHTTSAPQRYITIVIPASHNESGPGEEWFAATAARPDPAVGRPPITVLLTPGARTLLYMGPDCRGRTHDVATPDAVCGSHDERQFILVMTPAHIRAMDLERIPREGSLSTDPRDLPAQPVRASQRIPRDRLLQAALMAIPGVAAGAAAAQTAEAPHKELECKPLKVQDGRDVVDVSGRTIDLAELLGYKKSTTAGPLGATGQQSSADEAWRTFLLFVIYLALWFFNYLGLFLADRFFLNFVWKLRFTEVREHSVIKTVFFILVSAAMAGVGLMYVQI